MLKIDREYMFFALRQHDQGMCEGWYLDTETGQVILNYDEMEYLPKDLQENPRYCRIEPISSRKSFRVMEDFVETVTDAAAADRLARALEGRKPFRRFRDTLLDFPDLREAWFQFEDTAHTRMAEQWCAEQGIDVEWV